MAFDEPVLKWSDEKSSEDDKARTYNAGWTCHADSISDAYLALSSIGVTPGSDESQLYPGINCTGRDVSRIGSADLYSLTASFSQQSPEEGSGNIALRPWFVEWPDGSEQIATDRAGNGAPLVNSAGDPLEGATQNVTRFFVRITKWEHQFDLSKRGFWYNTVNGDSITICGYSMEPGQVSLKEYNTTGRVEFKPNGQQVPHAVEVYYLLELRGPRTDSDGSPIMDGDLHTGFHHRQLDAGMNGWYAGEDADGQGTFGLGNIQIPSSGDGVRTVYEGVTFPVRLDGHGVPLDRDAGYRINGKEDSDWATAAITDAVIDDSNPDAVYLLYLLHDVVGYANLLDSNTHSPFTLS